MKKFLLATATLLACTSYSQAGAVTLGGLGWDTTNATTITLSPVVPPGNQVKNIPCLICGENQPQQPVGFGFNDFGNTGNKTDLAFFSSGIVKDTLANDTLGGTNYSAAFLIAFLQAQGDTALTFSVGLDVNDTNKAQTLASFFFLDVTQKTVLSAFTIDTLVPSTNNGTGFPDYSLNGLTLQGVNPGDQLAFFGRITGANDGPDSFFLLNAAATPAVPEASTWAMLLAGFCGLGLFGMKRGQSFRLAA